MEPVSFDADDGFRLGGSLFAVSGADTCVVVSSADLPAAFAWVRRELRPRRLFAAGHSFGGGAGIRSTPPSPVRSSAKRVQVPNPSHPFVPGRYAQSASASPARTTPVTDVSGLAPAAQLGRSLMDHRGPPAYTAGVGRSSTRC